MKLDSGECLISIIVPMYNVEATIERCVRSLLTQTYKNIEIILIDDGSEDGTASICDNLQRKNENIILVRINNAGVSSARNKGIDVAKGDYILFVDSDDYVAQDYVEKMVKNEKNHYITICGYNKIDGHSQKSVGKVFYDHENKVTIVPKEDFYKLYQSTFSSAVWNKIYERSIIKENNIAFPVDISLGEDLLFNLKYFEKVDGFRILNEDLYNYVIDKNGLNYRYRKDGFEIYEYLYSYIFEFADDCKVSEKGKSILKNLMIKDSYTALWGYIRNEDEKYIIKRKHVKRKMDNSLFSKIVKEVILSKESTFLYRVILRSKSILLYKIYEKVASI